MTKVTPQLKRRRGAQPGNSNRRIHGYYARDTREARARLKLVADRMYAGLETFRYIADRLADLKRSPATKRKKRQIEDRMTLVYFEICAEAWKMAAEIGFTPFEPAAAWAASNAPASPPAHSNPPIGPGNPHEKSSIQCHPRSAQSVRLI